jgi:glycosyltransferase involved in cell wall biosynthesis
MSNKPIVWIFSQDSGTPDMGWGERHYYLAEEFIDAGFEVVIFAGSFSHKYIQPKAVNSTITQEVYGRVRFCWIKTPSYSSASGVKRVWAWSIFALKLFFLRKKDFGRPRFILVSSVPIFPVAPAIYYKYRYNAKFIFEIRDIWPLTLIELGQYSKYHPFVILLSLIEKFGYAKSDYITSVMENAVEHIKNTVSTPIKFKWISNGTNTNDEETIGPVNRLPSELRNGKFIVGYAGSMGISNAMEYFVAAARLLREEKEIHFVFLGDGPDKAKLEDQSRDLSNITFLDKVPKNSVGGIISQFHIGVSGSRNSSLYRFGIASVKLYDYMRVGLPIVLASPSDFSVVRDAKCGLQVEAESPKAIAEAILKLHRMPKQDLMALSQSGKQYLKQCFSYKSLAKQYLQIFDELRA